MLSRTCCPLDLLWLLSVCLFYCAYFVCLLFFFFSLCLLSAYSAFRPFTALLCLQTSTSVRQTTEDVATTPAAATRPVASSVAVTQDTTEMDLPVQVIARIQCVSHMHSR